MDGFSEKSLIALGDFYVYGLIDPRNHKIFYIGKGSGNRVFEHEKEMGSDSSKENLKLDTIAEIRQADLEVEKIIIHSGLTESEAFAAEAALINAFNYLEANQLVNKVSGHHASEALRAEEFEKIYGAIELRVSDIKHKILVIKINRLYHRGINKDELYDTVRGIWKASLKRVREVEYVFGVYNSLIVAVYKPTDWFVCKDAKGRLPRQDGELAKEKENRVFFVDEAFERDDPMDECAQFYLHKSISGLKANQGAQNPITYLDPEK